MLGVEGKQMRMRNGIGSGMIIENQKTRCQVCGWHEVEVWPYTLCAGHRFFNISTNQ